MPSGSATGTTVAAIAAGRLEAGRDVNIHYHGHYATGFPLAALVHGDIPSRFERPFVGRQKQLEAMERILGDAQREAVVVLHGLPGVGKTELAYEYARRHADCYPGGCFAIDATGGAPVRLAEIGRTVFGLDYHPNLTVLEQCKCALRRLAAAPVLVIYDNVRSPEAVEPWLPAAGTPCHVVMTSVVDRWDVGYPALPVPLLTWDESVALVTELTDAETCRQHGTPLIDGAGGLPVQLVPATAVLARSVRRGQATTAALRLTPKAAASFLGVYELLEPAARLLLQAAALRNGQRMARSDLADDLLEAARWDDEALDRQLDACLDLRLLEGGGSLRMHQLFAGFLLSQPVPEELADVLEQVRQKQWSRLVAVATELASAPNRTDLMAVLSSFTASPSSWKIAGVVASADECVHIGHALLETGQFAAAQPWYELAVAASEKGDVRSHIDHQYQGNNLHQVGICLLEQGHFSEAQPWFERAVNTMKKGQQHDHVDYERFGHSHHHVGLCLSKQGQFGEAQEWFVQAVAIKEKAHIHGRVDYRSIGISLHQVGFCLSKQGRFGEAQVCLEQAVVIKNKGDIHGRVDHRSVGFSLHLAGFCLSKKEKFGEAQARFEQAVAVKEKGDIHGRLDYQSIGYSLHQIGFCLSKQGQLGQAQARFEQAAAIKEKGDIYGRVDHESLSISQHAVATSLSWLDQDAMALPWYKRAVTESEKGDVHSRVDHESLGSHLYAVGYCLLRQGEVAEAQSWLERAADKMMNARLSALK